MVSVEPTLETLRAAVLDFGGYAKPDAAWETLRGVTAPELDPARAAHRKALHAWLNAWGCRIRYPRPGEPDVFDAGIGAWWARWGARLPDPGTSIVDLTDDEITTIGEGYTELAAAIIAQPRRSLGPTATSKLFYALRPVTLMPWDEMIANTLHGRERDGSAFAAHQRLGRDWGRRLLAEAGTGESGLAEAFGCPGRSLVKMLDDYCYIVFTRDARAAAASLRRDYGPA